MDEDELDINDGAEKVGTLRVELKKSDTDQKAKVKTKNEESVGNIKGRKILHGNKCLRVLHYSMRMDGLQN